MVGVLLAAALSGCFGQPKGSAPKDTSTSDTPTPTPTPESNSSAPTPTTNTTSETPNSTSPSPTSTTQAPTNSNSPPPTNTSEPAPNETNQSQPLVNITITAHPVAINASDPIRIEWEIATKDNQSLRLDQMGVFWTNQTVEAPNSTDDYPESNGTQDNALAPGAYNLTFNVTNNETVLFLRVHGSVNDTDFWSQEIQISVNVTIVTIDHGDAFSRYHASPLTIKAGEGIRWNNTDSTTHTATSDAGAPMSFSTGEIQGGNESRVIFFPQAGTYDYHCAIHPTTMHGRIIVEA